MYLVHCTTFLLCTYILPRFLMVPTIFHQLEGIFTDQQKTSAYPISIYHIQKNNRAYALELPSKHQQHNIITHLLPYHLPHYWHKLETDPLKPSEFPNDLGLLTNQDLIQGSRYIRRYSYYSVYILCCVSYTYLLKVYYHYLHFLQCEINIQQKPLNFRHNANHYHQQLLNTLLMHNILVKFSHIIKKPPKCTGKTKMDKMTLKM